MLITIAIVSILLALLFKFQNSFRYEENKYSNSQDPSITTSTMSTSMPDPYKNSRQVCTQWLLDHPRPASPPAKEGFLKLYDAIKNMVRLLAFHSAMEPNIQQTWMTPAKSKNKIYFMWDFWCRSFTMITQCDPSLSKLHKDSWEEMKLRVLYGLTFMTNPANCDAINESAHRGSYDYRDFGPEVDQATRDLQAISNTW